jgi:hypothetical protein
MSDEQRSIIKWSGWIDEAGACPIPDAERDQWALDLQDRPIRFIRSGDSILFMEGDEIFDCILRRRKVAIRHNPGDLDTEA